MERDPPNGFVSIRHRRLSASFARSSALSPECNEKTRSGFTARQRFLRVLVYFIFETPEGEENQCWSHPIGLVRLRNNQLRSAANER